MDNFVFFLSNDAVCRTCEEPFVSFTWTEAVVLIRVMLMLQCNLSITNWDCQTS